MAPTEQKVAGDTYQGCRAETGSSYFAGSDVMFVSFVPIFSLRAAGRYSNKHN